MPKPKLPYKGRKLKVLLLGSFHPSERELARRYRRSEPLPADKLRIGQRLYPMELLLQLEVALRSWADEPLMANKHNTAIRDVWQRVVSLMKQADLVLVLVSNYGGVAVESGIVASMAAYREKAIFLVDQRDERGLSGMLRDGLFVQRGVHKIYFADDNDLIDLTERAVDSFRFEIWLAENPSA